MFFPVSKKCEHQLSWNLPESKITTTTVRRSFKKLS